MSESMLGELVDIDQSKLIKTRPSRIYFAIVFIVAAFTIMMLSLWLAQSREAISNIIDVVTKHSIPSAVKKIELSKTLEIIRGEGDRTLFGADSSIRNEAFYSLNKLSDNEVLQGDARSKALTRSVMDLIEESHTMSRDEISGRWSILSVSLDRYSKEISFTSLESLDDSLVEIRTAIASDRSRLIFLLTFVATWSFILLMVIFNFFIKPLTFIEKQIRRIEQSEWSNRKLISKITEIHSLYAAVRRLRAVMVENKNMHEILNVEMMKAKKDASDKADFLSSMSHEIKTPLSSIAGMIHLLEVTPLSDKQQRYVQVMAKTCVHLEELVARVLDISRIDADRLHLDLSPFRLSELLDDVRDMTQPAILKKHIDFHIITDPRIPAVLEGDRLRLKEIFINFISNATKHTSVGHIIAEVKLLEMVEQSARLKISVIDTGAGISEDEIGSLFQKFAQGHKRKFGGTGLGLAITKKLAQLMQGDVGVESLKGVGSTFWAEVQLGVVSEKKQNVELPHAPGPHQATSERGGVLVDISTDGVDDVLEEILFYSRSDYANASHIWMKNEKAISFIHGSACTPIGDALRSYKLRDASLKVMELIPSKQMEEMRVPDGYDAEKPAILVIDDTPSNLDMLSLLLDDVARIKVTTNPDHGIAILSQTSDIGLVILDVSMPVKSGFDVLRELKELGMIGRLKVIMISASGNLLNRDIALAAGADDFLDRGLSTAEIKIRIKNHLLESK